MNAYVNDAYLPYLRCDSSTQIFFGGSSSGKSYFIAQRIVLDCISGVNTLVTRNIGLSLRKSSFNEIKKAIFTLGVGELFKINETEMTCTCKTNGKQILFSGLDNVEKLKSVTPANGVLERVFIEEATEVRREAYLQLKKRLRGRSPHKKSITLAFNPILKSHWIYKEFFQNWDESKPCLYDEKRSLLILKTTYKDNHFLTAEDVKSLEDETDPYFYDVYTLGNWGFLGNRIFTNWITEDLSDRIPKFDNIYNGLDFGYTNPTAFVRAHVDNDQKIIYVIDEDYIRGKDSFDRIAEVVLKKIGTQYVYYDCATPMGGAVLRRKGVNAIASKKGADSVLTGIKWLRGYKIVVHVQCQNMINELTQYHWMVDRNGVVLQKPVTVDDHLIDALRYGTETLQTPRRPMKLGW